MPHIAHELQAERACVSRPLAGDECKDRKGLCELEGQERLGLGEALKEGKH